MCVCVFWCYIFLVQDLIARYGSGLDDMFDHVAFFFGRRSEVQRHTNGRSWDAQRGLVEKQRGFGGRPELDSSSDPNWSGSHETLSSVMEKVTPSNSEHGQEWNRVEGPGSTVPTMVAVDVPESNSSQDPRCTALRAVPLSGDDRAGRCGEGTGDRPTVR